MTKLSWLFWFLLTIIGQLVFPFSYSVILPLKFKAINSLTPTETKDAVDMALYEIVNSSKYIKYHAQMDSTLCIPEFGNGVQVKLSQSMDNTDCYELQVNKVEDEEMFGWICSKFYENAELFNEFLDFSPLRKVVAQHLNSIPPHPGYDASLWSNNRAAHKLFQDKSLLQKLETRGYVVIDDNEIIPKVTPNQHNLLSKYLLEKTNQGHRIRRDTVHFLTEEQALQCGLGEHFSFLMSIASHLNEHLNFRSSKHQSVHPATKMRPLTNPRSIQLAEYGQGEFYKPHSDNSLKENGVRSNFRHLTCILYCNDNWSPDMGGALRLWPGNRNYPMEKTPTDNKFFDVNPQSGRLLIFDSCLVHSVNEVTQFFQRRRALTLWINRPDDSGVRGETFY